MGLVPDGISQISSERPERGRPPRSGVDPGAGSDRNKKNALNLFAEKYPIKYGLGLIFRLHFGV
jgi:hypothetical protein